MSLYESIFKVGLAAKNPKRDTKGHNYKYATLDQILDILKPHLAEHNLLLLQKPYAIEQRIGVKTILICTKDDSDKSSSECSIDIEMVGKKDVQAVGSYITYLRRYSVLTLFNLAPEDDDGLSTLSPDVKPPTVTLSANQDVSKPNWDLLAEISKMLERADDVTKDKAQKILSANPDTKTLKQLKERLALKVGVLK